MDKQYNMIVRFRDADEKKIILSEISAIRGVLQLRTADIIKAGINALKADMKKKAQSIK